MKLIFLGPPGAGKGTVSKAIIAEHGIPQISTGDIFRHAVSEGTDLGKKVKSIIDSGNLVPDELTIALVKERLSKDDVKKGFILDGFPRTISQAEALSKFEKIDIVVDFDIPDKEILIKRLSGRLTCRKCSEIYNAFTDPPQKKGICDKCGGELYVRKDDELESIKKRLDVYEAQTAPLRDYYSKVGILKKIDATEREEKVLEQVQVLIKK
jgi:adenylate kinase